MEREDLRRLATEVKKATYLLSTLRAGKKLSPEEVERTLEEIERSLFVLSEEVEAIKRMSKLELALRRAIPLTITLFISLGTALIISHFEKTVAQYALLYAFAPLISAISGNFGLQSTIIIIRAMAVEGKLAFLKAVVKELCIAAITGAIVGVIAGGVAYLKTGTWVAFPAIALSLWAGMATSALVGASLPFISKYIGIDPALTSGSFETTLQDLISYSTYLTLLTLFHKLNLI